MKRVIWPGYTASFRDSWTREASTGRVIPLLDQGDLNGQSYPLLDQGDLNGQGSLLLDQGDLNGQGSLLSWTRKTTLGRVVFFPGCGRPLWAG